MIHIYSGNGKGKTTAGFGLVLRQMGHGKQVGIAQFLKDGSSGEMKVLASMHAVDVQATCMPSTFYFQMNEEEQKQTQAAIFSLFQWVQQHAASWDCIFLDEILDVIQLQLLQEEALLSFLQTYKDKEIILTGRHPSKRLQALCDYHTDMREEKHPYQKGISARKGVEY